MENQSSYVEITIDNTNVDADLVDFPVTLCWYGLGAIGYDVGSVAEEMITAGNSFACKSDGTDVRVTDESGTVEYPIDLVTCEQNADSSYSKFQAHTKIPTVSSAAPTKFRIYYGDPSASGYGVTDTYGRNNVWSSYNKGVYHLVEGSGTPVDSTGSGYDGSFNGASSPNQESGSNLYGYYQNLVAADSDYIELGDTAGHTRFDVVGDFSMSIAAHPGSAWNNASQFLMGRGQDWCRIRREASTAYIGFSRVTGGNTYTDYTTTSVIDNYFHHIQYNFKRSTGVAGLYVDGVFGASDTHASDTDTSTKHLRIGLNEDITARKWDGLIKEARFSATSRSAAWIKAEYWDIIDPEYLMSVGTPQRVGLINKSDHIIGLGHSVGFNIGFDREL